MNFMTTTDQSHVRNSLVFVRAPSRIGLLKAPKGEEKENLGVEQGPAYILTQEFLDQYPTSQVINLSFPRPEDIAPAQYLDVVAKAYSNAKNTIALTLSPTTTLISVGGDHSIALGSIGSILTVHDPNKVGIVMIDSHGDIHQPSTSPSGNFHGMWLRPVIDHFEHGSIDALVPVKVPASQLMYIGNLDIEAEEKEFIQKHNINTWNRDAIVRGDADPLLARLLHEMDHIHISLDIDVFSHAAAPATGMYISNGLVPEDVTPILATLRKAKSLSVDLVEVNPTLDGAATTIALAQTLLQTILGT